VRILAAEDDAVTRRLLQAHLTGWGHEVVMCADGAEAWRILKGDDPPPLVILDWMMPEMDGVTVCREIRKAEKQAYVYIILLTAKTRKEDVIEGLEAGADDYIVKPFDIHELRVRVRAGCRIITLQEDLMAVLAKSEFQATHDALTGIWNRKAILDRLETELERCVRERGNLSIAVADLDHFKRVNDTHGHVAGDAVLREVVNRLVSCMRPYDVVGRYGGEEFLVILPGCDSESALGVTERLRHLLTKDPLLTTEGTFPVTMSFGIASVDGKHIIGSDTVIKRADEAMYKAKSNGRNRVEAWREKE
jgi:two-component system, cell cycle response regulator